MKVTTALYESASNLTGIVNLLFALNVYFLLLTVNTTFSFKLTPFKPVSLTSAIEFSPYLILFIFNSNFGLILKTLATVVKFLELNLSFPL